MAVGFEKYENKNLQILKESIRVNYRFCFLFLWKKYGIRKDTEKEEDCNILYHKRKNNEKYQDLMYGRIRYVELRLLEAKSIKWLEKQNNIFGKISSYIEKKDEL